MEQSELEEVYNQLSSAFKGKKVVDALDILSNVIADISYDNNTPIIQTLALVNEAALSKYAFLLGEEDESTKH
jgi:hypothetical protein